MEPPAATPPTSGATAASTVPLSGPPYPESVESSPRSRNTDTWEGGAGESLPPVPGGAKLRLMCSYGGHIVPRPHDKSLCYVGGETRIVVVERNSSLPELLQRLSKILLNGRPFTLKYQLPNEDLDSLITVSSEEDLENMIDEYDRLNAGPNPARNSRIRLFLFPTRLDVAASMGPILDGSNKSDDWLVNVLNSADLLERGFSDPSAVNTLLGLQENGRSSRITDLNSHDGEGQAVAGGMDGGKGKVGNQSNPDVHSVLDSSMAETNSSFGSASSSPAMLNLPRIRVHVDEGLGGGGGGGGARVFDQRTGIEDQFAQMGVNAQKPEDGFIMMSSPPSNLPVTGAPVGVPGEYTNRITSDDERSDHGAPLGYQTRQPPQMVMVSNSQTQNKHINEDLPSPAASASSDWSNLSSTTTRQTPLYQDPSANNRVPANFIDPRMAFTDSSGQVQQAPESGYVLPSHYDQLQQQQSVQSQQQQQQQQQSVQSQQQSVQLQQAQHAQAQQQAQQFIHASNQYVHHHPAGGVPLSYYPVYPSQQPQNHQQQMDQRYPVYYVPAGQTHPYNLPVQQQQQPNYTEAANPTRMMAPPQNPEIPQPGVYRAAAATTTNPQLVQMPQQQQQFMGYPQMHHHPSQSMAPALATGQYAYELSDPAHPQVYFTQAPLAPQYQTMNSVPAMVLSDASAASAAANPNDNAKQQIRTSQPL